METLVIQTGTRHGRVAELSRSREDSFTIGRSFNNDLVLTDLHVAPQQLKLSREGETWTLSVLDETNPVLLNGKRVTDESPVVKSGDRLSIGRTRLSIFSEDHPVEQTRKLVLSNWLSGESINPILPVAMLLLACLIDFTLSYFEASTSLKWEEVASDELFAAVVIVLWAGIWAITGRIVRHQHHFGLQILATVAIFVFAGLLAMLAEYIAYPFHSPSVDELTGWLVFFAILSLLLRFNLMIATSIHQPGLVASVMAGLLVSVIYGFYIFGNTGEFQYKPVYSAELKPPIIGLYRGISTADYFSQTAKAIESLELELVAEH